MCSTTSVADNKIPILRKYPIFSVADLVLAAMNTTANCNQQLVNKDNEYCCAYSKWNLDVLN